MLHPLMDFSKISDDDLSKKLFELNQKLLRFSHGRSNVIAQLRVMIESIQNEMDRRRSDKITKDGTNKSGEVLNSETGAVKTKDELDKLINI